MLERGEETGTYLQTDGEDEQDEAELLYKLECGGINLHTEMSHQDAAKQDKGGSQRDAEYLDLA